MAFASHYYSLSAEYFLTSEFTVSHMIYSNSWLEKKKFFLVPLLLFAYNIEFPMETFTDVGVLRVLFIYSVVTCSGANSEQFFRFIAIICSCL